MTSSMAKRARLGRLVAARMLASLRASLRRSAIGRWRQVGITPDRLLIAPQDIRTADPTVASDIYAGVFVFSGQIVEVGGRSPFEVPAPSEDWARALHGFGWLRHLRASDSALSRSNGRALVDDWIRASGQLPAIAWRTDVLARRLLSWLSQSPLILEGCDRGFYNRFLRTLVRQVRLLRQTFGDTPDGMPRLAAALALAAAAVSLAGQDRHVKAALKLLDHELERQILADGGHISRNPAAVLDALVDALPIRQAISARGIAPSPVLMGSIDRMIPMLRFFRHAEGSFAHFNGMGVTPRGLVATVLAHDDSFGSAPANASHSGYQRLEAGPALVIADTGAPPPIAVSDNAHAGCLSFEFGSRGNLIVVNCGAPASSRSEWRHAARSTAAHSTLVVENASSARILERPDLARWIGAPIVEGPNPPDVQREDGPHHIVVTARHDGYAGRFGLVHERTLALAFDGQRLDGLDRLLPAPDEVSVGDRRFAVRFHLHPSVRASRALGGEAVLIVCPDSEAWMFTAPGLEIGLEESVFLSGLQGLRRTEQIVLQGHTGEISEIMWRFERQASGRSQARRPPAEETGLF
ncbi:heparinase [Rhizobiales bacterium Sp-1]|uniref:Heparinase n=2 Tax=Segnochrobactrum spirostomi TaxID=2608987 RepID=A0A6A7Y3Z5_9HYPH|nr:heparinase [Segnochrobactrum spirostomi]